MKLLLQENIKGLGEIGEIVDVSDGYGRNYLLPQRLAVPNTLFNRRLVEDNKVIEAQREIKRAALAEAVSKDLKNALLQINMKAKDDGGLYGAVTAGVVVDVIEKAKGFRVEERWVQLAQPIKKIGDYDIMLKSGTTECTFKLTVLPEEG